MKEESDDDDDDDVESIPQTKKKKILSPVYLCLLFISSKICRTLYLIYPIQILYSYIIDLLSYLKASDDPDKLEVALKASENLIREKSDFGVELGCI
jgi:hypothetical protein